MKLTEEHRNRLIAARRSRNLTQSDLAALVDTTQATISRVEAGAIDATEELVGKIAAAIGLEARYSLSLVRAPK